jgi:hypothetical protein
MDFSFQLYSARNFQPWPDVLTMLAAAGYAQVEGFGGVYDDPAAFRRDLDRNGLTMPSGHFSIDALETGIDGVIATASTLGIERIFCPHLSVEDRPANTAGWQGFARRLSAIGERVRGAGFGFGWHNHDFEFQVLEDGTVPMQILLDTAPTIEWEADIAWIIRGGADPPTGSTAMGTASPLSTSRTSPPKAKPRMKTAGRMSAMARSTGRGCSPSFAPRHRPGSSSWNMTTRRTRPVLRRARLAGCVQTLEQKGMTRKILGVGIIGCGNISTSYLGLAPMFRGYRNPRLRGHQAKRLPKHVPMNMASVPKPSRRCLQPMTSTSSSTSLCPSVHYEVSAKVLDAGKHVYSEKPFVLSVEEGRDLAARAEKNGLRVGSGSGHLSRWRASACPASYRRGPGRPHHRRDLSCAEPRHGALAPEP